MAAMQGANMAGADSRCLSEGVSSQSAFIRVARHDDQAGQYHLDLRVPFRPRGMEPIDSLQTLYDRWKATVAIRKHSPLREAELGIRLDRKGLRLESSAFQAGTRVSVAFHSLAGARILVVNAEVNGNHLSIPLPAGPMRFISVETASIRWYRTLPVFDF